MHGLKKERSLPNHHKIIALIFSRVVVQGFGLDVWIYCTLCIHTVRDYRL
jgi:hypothetical protein